MSLFKIIVLFSVFAVTVGLCFAQSAPYSKIVNQENGFSIDVPGTWKIAQTPPPDTIVYAENISDNDTVGYIESMSVIVETHAVTDMTLEEACNVRMLNLSNELDQYRHVDDDVERIDNTDTHWFNYTYTKNENNLTDLSYIILNNNRQYTITFSSLTADFEKHKGAFFKIARSFRLLK